MAATHAIMNARIRTMDQQNPWAQAVAWRDGIVVALGDDAQVREACDATTQIQDAHGAVLTPGIVDGHQHLLHGAEFAQGVSLDRAHSLKELLERVAAERKRIGPGKWLMGYALEYAAFEGAQFHHELFNAAAGDGPMLLWALDVHTAFVNERALEIARLSGPVTLDDGSIVVVDANEKPTGELKEMRAIRLVLDHAPVATRDERLAWYAEAIKMQNAVGITEIHMMDGNLDSLEVFADLEASGDLGMRVLQHHFVYPYTDQAEVDEMLNSRTSRGELWQADGVKFMLDGVIDTGTAWLSEPDSYGEGNDPMWPELSLYHHRVREFDAAGFRIATHAIGDRAVVEVLNTYGQLPSGSAGRHRIEHIEMAPNSVLRRFAPERVTASMQPIHLRWLEFDLSDPWSTRLGKDRCSHTMPSGDLYAAGGLVVLGSDWPVAPFDPRMGFFAAQRRRAHDVDFSESLGASRALTGEEMLAGYTRNSAQAVGSLANRGTIAIGKAADLVLWGDDPVTCSPEDVIELPVLRTVVAGRTVFSS